MNLLLDIAWLAMVVMILTNYAGFGVWYLTREEGGLFMVFLFFALIAAGGLALAQASNAITLIILLFSLYYSIVIGCCAYREGKKDMVLAFVLNDICAVTVLLCMWAMGPELLLS